MAVSRATSRSFGHRLFQRVISVAALTVIASAVCFSQQFTVLKNVTVIDGMGHAAQRNQVVVIKDDRLQAIAEPGPQAPFSQLTDENAAKRGITVIDMQGQTIMPLIISTHGHLGLVEGLTQSANNQTDANIENQLLRYQAYGVGAVLSMGTDGQSFAVRRDESRNGTLPGADIYTAGIGFGTPNGLPPISMGFTGVLRPATADEARAGVDQQASLKPDVMKLWLDDFWGQYPIKMQPEVYTAIIDEAHKNGIRVAAHIYHLADAQSLVDAGVDIIAHSVRDGEIDDALLAKMKKNHVVYIPTMSLDDFAFAYESTPAWINDPFFQYGLEPGVLAEMTDPAYQAKVRANPVTAQEIAALPIAMKNFKKLYDAGILISLGSDSGASPIRVQGFAEHMELVLMVQAGISPLQAIEIATRNGAKVLRIEDQYGTLEPGKKANFIVLDQDPSNDIYNTQSINEVWKNGVKVSDGTLLSK